MYIFNYAAMVSAFHTNTNPIQTDSIFYWNFGTSSVLQCKLPCFFYRILLKQPPFSFRYVSMIYKPAFLNKHNRGLVCVPIF